MSSYPPHIGNNMLEEGKSSPDQKADVAMTSADVTKKTHKTRTTTADRCSAYSQAEGFFVFSTKISDKVADGLPSNSR
jgi:hypothetical protein